MLFTIQGYVSDEEEDPKDVGSAQVEEEFEYNDEDVEYVAPDTSLQPLALVTMHTLHLHESPPADQRENIFHTHCTVKGQSLCAIIDGGSCCNLINKRVVEHLQLSTTKRSNSYSLNGINESKEENLITHQCLVHFSIGPYNDSVTCDVTEMDCTHLLLGRP